MKGSVLPRGQRRASATLAPVADPSNPSLELPPSPASSDEVKGERDWRLAIGLAVLAISVLGVLGRFDSVIAQGVGTAGALILLAISGASLSLAPVWLATANVGFGGLFWLLSLFVPGPAA